MRKTIVLGTMLILVQLPLLAYVLLQERTWGGVERDGANGVAAAADGSAYVTGSTRSFGAGGDDAFLLKYDANGTLLWQRTYGTAPDQSNSGQEAGIGVAVAPDGGVVMLGNYRDGNIFLAKFNSAGTLLWARTWGGNEEGAGGIAIASNGTIYVTGFTSSFDVGQGDAFVLSFSADGVLNWQRTWGGELFDVGRDIAVATDGAVYVSGDTANSAFLVKFDAAGGVLWQREWGLLSKSGVPGETFGGGVAAAPAGGAYVSGWSHSAGADPNLLAARFDSAGNFVWQRVGGPGFGAAPDIAVGSDGNVHVAGNVLTDGGDTGANAFVWTLTAAGKGQDAAVWGGSDPFQVDAGASVAGAPGGSVVVVGTAGAPTYTFARGSKNAKAANTYNDPIFETVTTPGGRRGDAGSGGRHPGR
jgi:hypothetical protein